MLKIAVDIEVFTSLKDIIHTPRHIHLLPKFQNKMYTALDLCDRDDGCLPMVTAR